MEYTIKAIPTEYAGVQFRSRTEARWAAFFDLVGLKWDYEPLDLERWAPDFILRTSLTNVLVEVKPVDLTAYIDAVNRGGDDVAQLSSYDKALAHSRKHQVLLLGIAPLEMQGATLPIGIHTTPPRGAEYSFDDMQDALTVGDTSFVTDAWRKAGSVTQWTVDEPDLSTSQIVSRALNRAHRKAEQKRAA
ncbi:hypothetical protein GJU94_13935 [Brucella sp. 10RB9214]|uniref:hypothetical protein n=1 Tax=unclassified Brucella TaxID=2632610 RepID=UPI000972AEFE|nr:MULTISPECIES: hypothetical protein [unclassified Brucella]APY14300.1 hypothetical protein BKD02_08505 [Brucella sp. 09RB8910]MRN45456.1 hypothetical protein [Brucella sp. 10RB9212]MRN50915.1 hypothetical protein [Brucella sp. 10RB9214]